MRLYSTAESVDKGEISILAIVETIAATSLAIYLSVKFGSFKWIAWSACIAPFLLLRTEQSTVLGIKLWDEIADQTVAQLRGTLLYIESLTSDLESSSEIHQRTRNEFNRRVDEFRRVRRQRKWESELGVFSGELVTLRLSHS